MEYHLGSIEERKSFVIFTEFLVMYIFDVSYVWIPLPWDYTEIFSHVTTITAKRSYTSINSLNLFIKVFTKIIGQVILL